MPLRVLTGLDIPEQLHLGSLSTTVTCCPQDQGLYFRSRLDLQPVPGLCYEGVCFLSVSLHSSISFSRFQDCPEQARSPCQAWGCCRALSLTDSVPAEQHCLVRAQPVWGLPWLLPWVSFCGQLALPQPVPIRTAHTLIRCQTHLLQHCSQLAASTQFQPVALFVLLSGPLDGWESS